MLKIDFDHDQFTSFVEAMSQGDQAVREGLEVAFTSIATDVAAMAALDAPYKTGNLKASILWDVFQNPNGNVEATVGSNLVYARIQEFGGYTGRGYRSFIKPKLYLTGAVERYEKEIPQRIDKWIRYQQVKRGLGT